MYIQSLNDIINSNLCIGCGICQSIAGEDVVRLQICSDGFLKPVVIKDVSNIWGIIKNICPGIVVERESRIDDNYWHKTWGTILDIEVGYATDYKTRWRASSGGVISAILCFMLDIGMIDYVIQIGSNQTEPLNNIVFINNTREEVLNCAGSRYAPASPLIDVKSTLELHDGFFAFVGKPCDVAALRAYLSYYPELSPKVRCVMSFFCAGTPSLLATREILTKFGIDPNQVVSFSYRGYGWPGNVHILTSDGRIFEMDYENSWGNILNKNLNFRCKLCADGIGELADIVCGDAWFVKNGNPDFENKVNRPGRSFLLSRTETGKKIIQNAKKSNWLSTEPYNIEELDVIQPYQAKKRKLIASRLIALAICGHNYPIYKGFQLSYLSRELSLKENINSFIVTVARLNRKSRTPRKVLIYWTAVGLLKVILMFEKIIAYYD